MYYVLKTVYLFNIIGSNLITTAEQLIFTNYTVSKVNSKFPSNHLNTSLLALKQQFASNMLIFSYTYAVKQTVCVINIKHLSSEMSFEQTNSCSLTKFIFKCTGGCDIQGLLNRKLL